MKALMKPLFELLTGDFVLFDNIIYNYIAMGIIGLIAFTVAFKVVGRLYKEGFIEGRGAGSIIHWILRLAIFVIVFYIFSLVIWVCKFIASIQWWVWIIIGVVVVAIVVLLCFLIIKSQRLHRESPKNKED